MIAQNNSKAWQIFWIGVVLVVIGSGYSLTQRYKVEAANKAVSIAVESQVIEAAAANSKIDYLDAVMRLKQSGLGAVVLSEQTVKDLEDKSLVSFIGQRLHSFEPETSRLSRYLDGLVEKQPEYFTLKAPADYIRSRPVGLDPQRTWQLDKAGLLCVARFGNFAGISKKQIDATLDDAKTNHVYGLLPQGDEVFGNRAWSKDVSDGLIARGIVYISPEFAKIAGDDKMVATEPGNSIRLHSIQAQEIVRMGPGAIVERFSKAFAERNIRILLVRPIDSASNDAITSLADTIRQISASVTKEGGVLATPHPYTEPGVPRVLFLVIAVGIGLASVGLVCVRTKNAKFQRLSIGIPLFISALAWVQTGRELDAFFAACLFPIAAYLWLLERADRSPMVLFWTMAGISLVGGLAIGGLLNELPFFVKAEVFLGVKPAHFIPIVAAGALLLAWNRDWKAMFASPVTYAALTFGVVVLAILGFMLSRTGNDNPAGVSSFELLMRGLLEKYLVVRPRTKEFLIGYPALWIGLSFLRYKKLPEASRSLAAGLFLFVGSIGLTSLVNTMCHLHTPIAIGLVRIVMGLVLGLIFGAVAWIVLKSLMDYKLQKSS